MGPRAQGQLFYSVCLFRQTYVAAPHPYFTTRQPNSYGPVSTPSFCTPCPLSDLISIVLFAFLLFFFVYHIPQDAGPSRPSKSQSWSWNYSKQNFLRPNTSQPLDSITAQSLTYWSKVDICRPGCLKSAIEAAEEFPRCLLSSTTPIDGHRWSTPS